LRQVVVKRADGRALWTVEVADSWWHRLRGLIGRSSIAGDEGLFLPGTNSIHMAFMRFPIDCVFVTKAGAGDTREVVAVRPNLRPWTGVVWYVRHAAGAIEIPAGAAETAALAVGDQIRLEPAG
jgi:uncharacterized membrane protein (UPF0127 family)